MNGCPVWIVRCSLMVLTLLVVAATAGCSSYGPRSAAAGGASYELRKTGNDCTIVVNSSREVSNASVSVDGADCSMTADVGPMGGPMEDLFVDMTRSLLGTKR